MKSCNLSRRHYAAKWSESSLLSLAEANALGLVYHQLPDGEAKQEAFLKIARHFHGYLMKYLGMICAGHVPFYGLQVNKDVEAFLHFFLHEVRSCESRHAY